MGLEPEWALERLVGGLVEFKSRNCDVDKKLWYGVVSGPWVSDLSGSEAPGMGD